MAEWLKLLEEPSFQPLTLVSVDFLTLLCAISLYRDFEWGKVSFSQVTPLPLSAAGLMHTFNAHAATDITGFGILGHAQNLAKQQRNEVSFVIHNLPVLAKMAAVSKACGNMFGLMHGTCPETSGTRVLFPDQAKKALGTSESPFCMRSGMTAMPLLLWVCSALWCD